MCSSNKKLIIIGASGHGKVIADIAIDCGYEIVGFLDDNEKIQNQDVLSYKVIGKIKDLENYINDCEFIIAIGNNSIRKKIAEQHNVKWATLIHSTAIISKNIAIGEGTVVMPKAVINSSTRIGKHCIINTAAVIEHDNVIHDYVHISPGALLGGTVEVGESTHIGIGACVKNNVKICGECSVGAGAVVVKNIEEVGVYVGCPVKIMKKVVLEA